MEFWIQTATIAELLMDAAIVGGLLLVGTLARRYVGLIQRYLLPNSLVAGFIGLALGPEAVGALPFSLPRMEAYVYHLLALTFIGVGLQGARTRHSWGAVNLGFMQVSTMLIQGLLGLAVVLTIFMLVNPSIVPAAGMLLPLGFAMGPGIALTIGRSWATFGFPEAASVGLTIATIGYLVAYVGGVALVRRAVRSGAVRTPAADPVTERGVRTGIRNPGDRPAAGHMTFHPGAIEPLTVHLAVIAAVYALTYGLAWAAARGLSGAGLDSEVPIVWSFHFILANLLALLAGRFLSRDGGLLDPGLLHRITGLMADLLIATSIMAISLSVALQYAVPVLLVCSLGAVVTYAWLRAAARRVFSAHRFDRFIAIFGEMTGTVSSGLALIRITDPEYRSPVAQDLVLSSGVALALGFPLLIVINLPFSVFDGALRGYLVAAALMVAYLALILWAWSRFIAAGRRAGTDST